MKPKSTGLTKHVFEFHKQPKQKEKKTLIRGFSALIDE